MSFTEIPELDPYKDLTLEDAVNLLLSSIASEEMSLSRLIDAQTNKILFITNTYKYKGSALQDTIDINKSVDHTIKDITKLQMLLQYNLENVKEFLSTSSTASTTKTSTHTTSTTTTACAKTTTTNSTYSTTTHTTTSTTTTCSTTTKNKCEFHVIGKDKGLVSNPSDEFYRQTADLQVLLYSSDFKKRLLYYFIQNDTDSLQLKASSTNIVMDCENSKRIIIHGQGQIEKRSKFKKNIAATAYFQIIVFYNHGKTIDYRITIKSDSIKEIDHDSGIIINQDINFSFE